MDADSLRLPGIKQRTPGPNLIRNIGDHFPMGLPLTIQSGNHANENEAPV